MPNNGYQSKNRRTKWLPEVVLPDVSRLTPNFHFVKTFSNVSPHRALGGVSWTQNSASEWALQKKK